ncbi:uncharacterized protein LOC110716343 [Chenopodium quinoa]|uniref:uncharacterized protein LOC110716343 n=1 Tax=Chenopodium quinoa TaxID=63459 RepID=UPI000B788E60|nr:uncharacterized protein LOC110716343 [Chenopodium quinoa]
MKDVITDVIDVPIVIPIGGVVQCTKTFKDVPLEIEGKMFLSDLIEFGLSDFDVILGMDWLSKYSAEIRCLSQKVQISTAEGDVRNLDHEEAAKLEDIEVVNEFLDVFPEEIPGMPPKRAIDFTIELAPGTSPISKAPYRMAPAEMSEVKKQLQDVLEKRVH